MPETKTRIGTPDIHEDMRIKLTTAYFAPGEKLKSEALREIYGCSANTIREVLFRLSTAGLVSFEDQRGFRARKTSRQRQHELTKFRIILEQQGSKLSIENGDIEWEARLSAAHHKLSHIESEIRKTNQIEPVLTFWSAAEWEFHDTLISACDSVLLRETYKTIYDQFRQQLVTRETNYGYFAGNITEHKQIVDAALDRDANACSRHIHNHLARNMIKD